MVPLVCGLFHTQNYLKLSVAERPAMLHLSVVSSNSAIPRVLSSIISYFTFRFTAAYY